MFFVSDVYKTCIVCRTCVQCTIVQLYNVQCTMYNVQCTMYNVQLYNVYNVYNVQCTMYNCTCVQCTHSTKCTCMLWDFTINLIFAGHVMVVIWMMMGLLVHAHNLCTLDALDRFKGTITSRSTGHGIGECYSCRLTQWLKIIPHMIRSHYCCSWINEPVMFSHCGISN